MQTSFIVCACKPICIMQKTSLVFRAWACKRSFCMTQIDFIPCLLFILANTDIVNFACMPRNSSALCKLVKWTLNARTNRLTVMLKLQTGMGQVADLYSIIIFYIYIDLAYICLTIKKQPWSWPGYNIGLIYIYIVYPPISLVTARTFAQTRTLV